MKLKASWHRVARDNLVRELVEQAYEERLLELFGTVEAAHRSKEQWHRQGEPPMHPWNNYNSIAFSEATAWMTPTERRGVHIAVRFE